VASVYELIREYLESEKRRMNKAGNFIVSMRGEKGIPINAFGPDSQPVGEEYITPEELDLIALEGKLDWTIRNKLTRLVLKLPTAK
jgi:hypothetical protein